MKIPKRCAAAVILTLVLGACGGGGGGGGDLFGGGGTVSAEQYVKTACTDLSAWVKSIQQRAQKLETASPSSAEEGKKLFTGFYDGIVADTGKLEDQLKAAGTPDIKDGDKIAQGIVNALDKVRSVLQQSRARVENLPTDNPQAFSRAVQAAGQSVQTAFQRANIGSDLQSPELTAAAKKEPACQSIGA